METELQKSKSHITKMEKLESLPPDQLTSFGLPKVKHKANNEYIKLWYRSKKLGVNLNAIAKGAKQEMARRHFWWYCNFMANDFYTEKREYLKTICNELEAFENDDTDLLIVNAPPRFGKSRTSCLFVEWLLGRNNHYKVMTGSYNETLSTIFSKQVRNAIMENRGKYNGIFPKTRIKYGDGAMNLWSLEGNDQYNYLATSPTGTATGFGADFIIIDDLIKSAYEAFNPVILESHWQWFTNTMYSRLEGKRKIMMFMTQWSDDDLPHRAKRHFESIGVNVKVLRFNAMNDDGTMLDSSILSKREYENKRQTLDPMIFETNYNNRVIESIDSLYPVDEFRTYEPNERYETMPDGTIRDRFSYIKSRTDTADEGSDSLVKIVYSKVGEFIYIIDIYMTKDPMEITEKKCAKMDMELGVNLDTSESNNGGKGFARNVEEDTRKMGNTKTSFVWKPTTMNKQSRILTNSTGIKNTFIYPSDWKVRFHDYYVAMKSYHRTGKNEHDDAPDCSTAVYEDEFVRKNKFSF
jgi:predicted phage terminase large subunit-like protein